MSNQTVKITKNPTTGAIVTKSESNPDYGFIRVESQTTSLQKGFLRTNLRTALIQGLYEDLKNYVETNNLVHGSKLPGKILVIETTEQPYASMQPKRAGAEGDILKKDGLPIYRTTQYTEDLNAVDVLIQHDAVAINSFITAANLSSATS